MPINRPYPYPIPESPVQPYPGKPDPPSDRERALNRNAVLVAGAMLLGVCLVCGLLGWLLAPSLTMFGH